MKSSKAVFEKAQAAGKTKKPFLRLGEQLEGGGVKPNGPHTIVLISDKVGKGKDAFGNEREELQLIVTEGGVEKLWNVPLKDPQGNLHYLVAKLTEFDEGDTVIVEMKKKGPRNYIDIRKVGEGEEVPTIQIDENGEEFVSSLEGSEEGEDISPEALPF